MFGLNSELMSTSALFAVGGRNPVGNVRVVVGREATHCMKLTAFVELLLARTVLLVDLVDCLLRIALNK